MEGSVNAASIEVDFGGGGSDAGHAGYSVVVFDPTRCKNKEERAMDNVIYFYPESTPDNIKMNHVGLCIGIAGFAQRFSDAPLQQLVTDKGITALVKPRGDKDELWLAATVQPQLAHSNFHADPRALDLSADRTAALLRSLLRELHAAFVFRWGLDAFCSGPTVRDYFDRFAASGLPARVVSGEAPERRDPLAWLMGLASSHAPLNAAEYYKIRHIASTYLPEMAEFILIVRGKVAVSTAGSSITHSALLLLQLYGAELPSFFSFVDIEDETMSSARRQHQPPPKPRSGKRKPSTHIGFNINAAEANTKYTIDGESKFVHVVHSYPHCSVFFFAPDSEQENVGRCAAEIFTLVERQRKALQKVTLPSPLDDVRVPCLYVSLNFGSRQSQTTVVGHVRPHLLTQLCGAIREVSDRMLTEGNRAVRRQRDAMLADLAAQQMRDNGEDCNLGSAFAHAACASGVFPNGVGGEDGGRMSGGYGGHLGCVRFADTDSEYRQLTSPSTATVFDIVEAAPALPVGYTDHASFTDLWWLAARDTWVVVRHADQRTVGFLFMNVVNFADVVAEVDKISKRLFHGAAAVAASSRAPSMNAVAGGVAV